jgi:hypothetical protein
MASTALPEVNVNNVPVNNHISRRLARIHSQLFYRHIGAKLIISEMGSLEDIK